MAPTKPRPVHLIAETRDDRFHFTRLTTCSGWFTNKESKQLTTDSARVTCKRCRKIVLTKVTAQLKR